MKSWKWFIVPPFELSELGYAHSIGLAAFIAIMKSKVYFNKESKSFEDEFVDFIKMQFIVFFLIGVCWAISRFTM